MDFTFKNMKICLGFQIAYSAIEGPIFATILDSCFSLLHLAILGKNEMHTLTLLLYYIPLLLYNDIA